MNATFDDHVRISLACALTTCDVLRIPEEAKKGKVYARYSQFNGRKMLVACHINSDPLDLPQFIRASILIITNHNAYNSEIFAILANLHMTHIESGKTPAHSFEALVDVDSTKACPVHFTMFWAQKGLSAGNPIIWFFDGFDKGLILPRRDR